MNRRSFLTRAAGWLAGAGAALSAAPRATQTALTTVRDSLGWLVVIGRHGETVIRISPRFALEHPRETLSLLTTGRLP